DADERFEKVESTALEPPITPAGHPFRVERDGTVYLYFTAPYPALRVKAGRSSYLDLARYEGDTCLKAGTRFAGAKKTELDRGADGKLVWTWKKDTPPLNARQQGEFVAAGKMKREESPFRLQNADGGAPVLLHGGSCAWNDYRKKYVMIASEVMGATML